VVISIPFTRDYQCVPYQGAEYIITCQGLQLVCEKCGWERHCIKKPDTGYWMEEEDNRNRRADLADHILAHESSCPVRTAQIVVQNGVANVWGSKRPSSLLKMMTSSSMENEWRLFENETKP
jgi:hypothetical protein